MVADADAHEAAEHGLLEDGKVTQLLEFEARQADAVQVFLLVDARNLLRLVLVAEAIKIREEF